jgi:DNA-binding response OmpR family regulator
MHNYLKNNTIKVKIKNQRKKIKLDKQIQNIFNILYFIY